MLVFGSAFLAAIPLPPMYAPCKPSISHNRVRTIAFDYRKQKWLTGCKGST